MHEVPGELVGLLDQFPEVTAGEAVEHPPPVPAGLNESDEAQPAQVLRYRGPRRGDLGSEGVHILFALGEQAQQV